MMNDAIESYSGSCQARVSRTRVENSFWKHRPVRRPFPVSQKIREMTERFDPQPDRTLQQAPPAPGPGGHVRRSRFRWWIITVPLTCALGIWTSFAIVPGWWWERQMGRWHVVYRNRFTAVVLLGVALLTALLMVRVICWVRNEKE